MRNALPNMMRAYNWKLIASTQKIVAREKKKMDPPCSSHKFVDPSGNPQELASERRKSQMAAQNNKLTKIFPLISLARKTTNVTIIAPLPKAEKMPANMEKEANRANWYASFEAACGTCTGMAALQCRPIDQICFELYLPRALLLYITAGSHYEDTKTLFVSIKSLRALSLLN